MYSIHSHYENVFHSLKNKIEHRRLLYLHPYGSTDPSAIELLQDPMISDQEGPLLVFYDQEPIYGSFNYQLFDHIDQRFRGSKILVTTEQNSEPLQDIYTRYQWPQVYYFHHAFAASDWFRGNQFDHRITDPTVRKLSSKYISFNRITSGPRVYRTVLVAKLLEQDLAAQARISYDHICNQGGNYHDHLAAAAISGSISATLASDCARTISNYPMPLRIDHQQEPLIPNQSFNLGPVDECMQSFCYLVTETCFWERKDHVTEKSFKPIAMMMPFVIAGPCGSLRYLKSYGFKTFDLWWNESYDDIEDPTARLEAIVDVMSWICSKTTGELEKMLWEMAPILRYNRARFNDPAFLSACWEELQDNLSSVL